MPRPNQSEAARLQVAILSLLGEHREVPIDYIARILGIPYDQASRQLEALACCSIGRDRMLEIYNEEERGTVVVYGALPELANPVRLNGSETRALDAALDAAGVAPEDPLRIKLIEASSSANLDSEELSRIFGSVLRENSSESMGALAMAIEQSHLVSFTHRNASTRKVSQRLVEPLSLAYQQGFWYLEGYSREAGALRTFRVDGIANVRDEGSYDPHPIAARTHSSTVNLQGLPRAVLAVPRDDLLAGHITWPGIEVQHDGPSPDEVTITVPYRGYNWLGRKIASKGGSVRVLEPAALGAAARAIAKATLAEAEQVWARHNS